ncbi:MAG TPA: transporter [Pyrinomonadaceae bacterium]|nr:transporter [Pyrinomonadaceae bacterium]
MTRKLSYRIFVGRIGILILMLIVISQINGQVRGVYPVGMSATNSGVTPRSGFSYSNLLAIYSRKEFRGTRGEILAKGGQTVTMDLNSIVWVSVDEILGGARFSMSATLPVANNSLTSEIQGPISGGQGFADSYYQPFILGWEKDRVAFRAVYGFLAPTGRFNVNGSDNVGSGYWTHALSSGQTIYLTQNKRTTLSAFQMYEIHTKQEGTRIHPGQTMNLDYSVTRVIPLRTELGLQIGVAGYNQWQTTDKTGPTITPEQAAAHYRVNALGFAANLNMPARVSVGIKYFKEFGNRSTFQGYSFQLAGAISF